MAADEEESLRKIVEENDDLEFTNNNSKVRCKSTGHEMKPRLEDVKSYINGAKYKKLRAWYVHDFSKHEPYIVQHDKMKKHLFCKLTGTVIPMDPKKVSNHVESKRFKELVKAVEEREQRRAEKKAAQVARREKARQKFKEKRAEALKEKQVKAEAGGTDAADGQVKKRSQKKRRRKAKVSKEGAGAEAPAGAAAGATGKKKKKVPLRALQMRRKRQFQPGAAAGAGGGEEKKAKTE